MELLDTQTFIFKSFKEIIITLWLIRVLDNREKDSNILWNIKELTKIISSFISGIIDAAHTIPFFSLELDYRV